MFSQNLTLTVAIIAMLAILQIRAENVIEGTEIHSAKLFRCEFFKVNAETASFSQTKSYAYNNKCGKISHVKFFDQNNFGKEVTAKILYLGKCHFQVRFTSTTGFEINYKIDIYTTRS